MKSYILKNNTNSKLAARYQKLCEQGKIGEVLITHGCGQTAFASFAAEVMQKAIESGMDKDTLSALFNDLALGNASQVRSAIASLEMFIDGSEKPTSVSSFWGKQGGAKPIVNNLDFLTE